MDPARPFRLRTPPLVLHKMPVRRESTRWRESPAATDRPPARIDHRPLSYFDVCGLFVAFGLRDA
jgi:hypothetical protein